MAQHRQKTNNGTSSRADRILEESQDIVGEVVGAKDWKRSKFGTLTGFSAFTSSLRHSVGAVGSFGKAATGLAKRAFGREQVHELPTDSDDPEARFQIAQQFYDRTDEDVEMLTRVGGRQALVFFILTIVALCWGILITPTTATHLFFPLGYLFPFFPVFPLVALFLRASFFNWQLRHRRLGSFREFMNSGELLSFSTRSAAASGKKVVGIFLATVMVGLLVPLGAAVAQVPGEDAGFSWTATLGAGDYFHQLLSFVLPGVGPLGDPPAGGSPFIGPLQAAFAAFNATLLIVGGALLGWFTLAGTVASAHEGKVLGSRWHYIWAPMRVTAGIGFLAPVAGGFCAAQLLVLQLIVWGGGIANTVWVGYVDSFAVSGDTSGDSSGGVEHMIQNSMQMGDDGHYRIALVQSDSMIREITAKLVCYHTVQEYDAQNGGSSTTDGGLLSWIFGGDPVVPDSIPNGEETWAGIESPGYDWDFGPLCGKVTLDPTNHDAIVTLLEQSNMSASEIRDELSGIGTRIKDAMDDKVIPDLNSVAISFVQAVHKDNEEDRVTGLNALMAADDGAAERVSRAKDAYELIVSQVAADILTRFEGGIVSGATTKLVKEAETRGWASSGVFYMTLARLQGLIHDVSEINLVVGNINPGVIDLSGDLARMLFGQDAENEDDQRFSGSLPLFSTYWDHTIRPPSGISQEALRAGQVGSDSDGYFVQAINYMFDTDVMASALTSMTVRPQNALVDMVNFGHKLMNIFMIAIALYLGLAAATSAAGAAVGGAAAGSAAFGPIGGLLGGILGAAAKGLIAALFNAVSFMLKLGLMIMLVVGVLHAYILPMIPYIMMLFFIVGMLILTVEAMVAAPIWAFFHIRMDGQEFVEQVQRPGYMIAFNLLLRPSLAVLGLVLSYSVFGASIWFLSETFHPAVVAATAGAGYGVIGVIVMLVILSYLHWQLALRSFSLITTVPDRVTRWFGQGGENLGEEGDSQKSTQFMVGHMTNRMDGAARGLAISGALNQGQQKTGNDQDGDNTPDTKTTHRE